MHLKLITWDEYGAVQDMVRKFTKASPYAEFEEDASKLSDLVISFIESPIDKVLIVAMDGEEPIGMLAGIATENLIGREKMASELMWWMEPEHRKSRIAFDLVDAYRYWAKKIGCKVVLVSTVETEQTERIAKFYSRKGFKPVERTFMKDL